MRAFLISLALMPVLAPPALPHVDHRKKKNEVSLLQPALTDQQLLDLALSDPARIPEEDRRRAIELISFEKLPAALEGDSEFTHGGERKPGLPPLSREDLEARRRALGGWLRALDVIEPLGTPDRPR